MEQPADYTLETKKNIALIAHDNMKAELIAWVKWNRQKLAHHNIFATGTTGRLIQEELGFSVTCFQSGPLGGDQQVGAKIAEGEVDFLVFFWDPLEPQPHDPDVKALLRLAVVWNIPFACNRATADFLITSPLMTTEYERETPDFTLYHNRYNRLKKSLEEDKS